MNLNKIVIFLLLVILSFNYCKKKEEVQVLSARSGAALKDSPYYIKPQYSQRGDLLIIKAKTNLPENTLFRLSVQRALQEKKDPAFTFYPEAGFFLPGHEINIDIEDDTLHDFVDGIRVGMVKNGYMEAQFEMYPIQYQVLGVTGKTKDDFNINTDCVTIKGIIEKNLPNQSKKIAWKGDAEFYNFTFTDVPWKIDLNKL